MITNTDNCNFNIVEEFQATLSELSSYAKTLNSQNNQQQISLNCFQNLDIEKQKMVLKNAKTYLLTIKYASENNWDTKCNKMFFWNALNYYQWRPSSDFLNYVTSDMAIEIYNLENIQVWRSLNVLELCSYTLEEVLCYTWEDRYFRNEEKELEVKQQLAKLFSFTTPETLQCNINNLVTEKFGSEKLSLNVNHVAATILFDKKTNHPAAFAVASNASILETVETVKGTVVELRI